jgi:transcriptional regulator of aroF, aroG, tyrA and aromatic amino acid transport
METPLKLKLFFEDKVGVLAGLALVMADEGFNVVAMEIEREGGTADIYVEAKMIKGTEGPEKLMARIANLPHILGIASIKTLPKERREKRFQALLDSVSDGILFIDEEANLAIINKIAEKALHALDQFEKDIIEDRLKKHKSIRKAADALMISHTSLLRKIKKHKN